MLKFLKKNKLIAFMSLTLMTILSAVVLSTVAWFTSQSATYTVDNLQVNSKILESYFDETSGNGLDAAHPLVISKPVHLYNLSYLHESNEMKLTDWTYPFADQGLYFQFGRKVDTKYYFYSYDSDGTTSESLTATTLDMNYYNDGANRGSSLIPIGTTAHPFIGHIAGNNLTVSNLHINGSGQADIGIFGYVGTGGSVSHCYFEKPVIDATGADARATSVEASPHTSYTNIGYLAGHITNANQFTNVYVNKAQLKNTSGSSYQMINSTGFFGKVDDPAVTPATSSTYAFGLNAKNAYDALDYANTEGSDKSLALRNVQDGFTASGTYTSAVTSNSSTYTFDQKEAGKPYSLSTIGYAQGENASTKHVRFLNDYSVLQPLSTTTNLSLASSNFAKPQTWTDAGNYVYYEDGQWYYNSVINSGSGSAINTDFNCFYLSYVDNSTTYYWHYNDNNTADDLTDDTLELTSTAPTDGTQDKYNFVFRENHDGSVYGPGIDSFSDVSEDKQVYIYSPAYKTYLYMECPQSLTGSNSTFAPEFVDDIENATLCNVGAYDTKITFRGKDNDNNIVAGTFFYSSGTIYSHKLTGQSPGVVYTIGTPLEDNSLTGFPYVKVTDLSQLSDNDRITLVGYNSTTPYMLGPAQTSNFSGVAASISNNQIIKTGSATKLRFEISHVDPNDDTSDLQYRFLDLYTDANLSSYGSNNTGSGDGAKRYLRFYNGDTQLDPSYWNVSIASSGVATISNKTNNVANKNLRYNSGSNLFNVYQSGQQDVYIFKRSSSSISNLNGDKSSAHVKQYQEISSQEKVENKRWSLYISDETATIQQQSSLAYNTLFTDAPSANTSFDVTTYPDDSRVMTTEIVTSYWRKVESEYQMSNNDRFIIVNESNNVALSTIQNTNDRSDTPVTAISGFIKDYNLSSSVQQLTGVLNDGKWSFATPGGYLAAGSSSTDSLITSQSIDANAQFRVSFDASGNATITFQGTYTHKILGYDSTNEVFSSFETQTGTIQIYKFVEMAANNSTYVGDLVGGGYEPSRMDVVGSASFVEDGSDHYLRLNESCSVLGAVSPNGTKDFHATAEVTQGGIVIIIDNTGSNDLGSLVVSYQETNGEKPYFKDKNNTSVSFSTCARDKDTNASDHIHEDVINFSSTNISNRAYCGLDSDGKIVAINADASKYVLVIGADSTIKIRDIQFSFTNIPGNIGKFSSVDFRTATYTDGVLTSSQPSQNGIAIYYDINDSTLIIDIRVTYVGSTYNVYINSNKATTITVFLYDESASLNVNGTAYYATSNQCNISANYTIPNSWDGSA